MNKSGFFISEKISESDFFEKFPEIVNNRIPKLARKGGYEAGNEVLHDAITLVPKAPRELGDLHGSAIVEDVTALSGREIIILMGFNIEYAARWHELPREKESEINWTLPGSGSKYLESKLSTYRDKYIKIIALTIKAGAY